MNGLHITGNEFRKRFALAFLWIAALVSALSMQASALTMTADDGEYSIEVSMTGGSGKATIVSPTILYVEDGTPYAQIQWSSSNYDYMIVDGKKYLPENEEGYSTFVIPILTLDEPMPVIADTTAMGAPHEVNYELTFYADSIDTKDALPQEATKKVLLVAFAIIIGGGILNHFVNKRRERDFMGK
ncbi:MAG: hypothetical protein ACI4PM_04700 [Butyricicoccus sp.]